MTSAHREKTAEIDFKKPHTQEKNKLLTMLQAPLEASSSVISPLF